MSANVPRRVVGIALLALALLFAAWFGRGPRALASLLVFAAPPALLLLALWPVPKRAMFWAGVLALFWFCHGVMVAWSRPAEATYAWAEIGLALVVVLASSWPGLRKRFGRKA